jgi:NAD(P)-dependent dehydrogenase (short-subunit alcohol dehydrogenase family)
MALACLAPPQDGARTSGKGSSARGDAGFFEDVTDTQARQVIETNFFGALVTRAALPAMRARRTGRIAVVSRVWGFRPAG